MAFGAEGKLWTLSMPVYATQWDVCNPFFYHRQDFDEYPTASVGSFGDYEPSKRWRQSKQFGDSDKDDVILIQSSGASSRASSPTGGKNRQADSKTSSHYDLAAGLDSLAVVDSSGSDEGDKKQTRQPSEKQRISKTWRDLPKKYKPKAASDDNDESIIESSPSSGKYGKRLQGKRNCFALSQADVTDSMPSQFHNDDTRQLREEEEAGEMDSFIVDSLCSR